MKYYAALLMMKDIEKNKTFRSQHLEFLEEKNKEGKIFVRGRFTDNSGGMVIYKAESLQEAEALANADPLVTSGARSLEIHEWDMK